MPTAYFDREFPPLNTSEEMRITKNYLPDILCLIKSGSNSNGKSGYILNLSGIQISQPEFIDDTLTLNA